MRKFRSVIVATAIISSLVAITAYAVPSSEELRDEREETEDEAQALEAELQAALDAITQLKEDIVIKNEELDQAGREMDLAAQSEYEQYEAMKKRIQYIYEESTSTKQMETIFEAKTISEMLNQALYVNEVYAYDRDKLDEYVQIKEEVQTRHEQYEIELAEYEDAQALMLQKQEALSALLVEKQEEIALLDSQIIEAVEREAEEARLAAEREEAARLEAERLEAERLEAERLEEERLEAEQEEENNNNSNNNSDNNGGDSSEEPSQPETPDAEEPDEPDEPSGSVTGQTVVDYAVQFIGNKYVYGGTSLTNGIDCSAFIMKVYAKYGYSVPRTSYSQRSAGIGVSYSEAKAGDIICYEGHVALYMGNGQIVHASNSSPYPKGGIKTGTATYRTILAVRRIIY